MRDAGCKMCVFIKTSPDFSPVCGHCYFQLAAGASVSAAAKCFGFYGRKFIVVSPSPSPLSTSANCKYCLCPLRSVVAYYTMFVASTISGLCWVDT